MQNGICIEFIGQKYTWMIQNEYNCTSCNINEEQLCTVKKHYNCQIYQRNMTSKIHGNTSFIRPNGEIFPLQCELMNSSIDQNRAILQVLKPECIKGIWWNQQTGPYSLEAVRNLIYWISFFTDHPPENLNMRKDFDCKQYESHSANNICSIYQTCWHQFDLNSGLS